MKIINYNFIKVLYRFKIQNIFRDLFYDDFNFFFLKVSFKVTNDSLSVDAIIYEYNKSLHGIEFIEGSFFTYKKEQRCVELIGIIIKRNIFNSSLFKKEILKELFLDNLYNYYYDRDNILLSESNVDLHNFTLEDMNVIIELSILNHLSEVNVVLNSMFVLNELILSKYLFFRVSLPFYNNYLFNKQREFWDFEDFVFNDTSFLGNVDVKLVSTGNEFLKSIPENLLNDFQNYRSFIFKNYVKGLYTLTGTRLITDWSLILVIIFLIFLYKKNYFIYNDMIYSKFSDDTKFTFISQGDFGFFKKNYPDIILFIQSLFPNHFYNIDFGMVFVNFIDKAINNLKQFGNTNYFKLLFLLNSNYNTYSQEVKANRSLQLFIPSLYNSEDNLRNSNLYFFLANLVNHKIYDKLNKKIDELPLFDIDFKYLLNSGNGFFYYNDLLEIYLTKEISFIHIELYDGLYNLEEASFLTYDSYEKIRFKEVFTVFNQEKDYYLKQNYPNYFISCKNYFNIYHKDLKKPRLWLKFLKLNLVDNAKIKNFCISFICFFINGKQLIKIYSKDNITLNFFHNIFVDFIGKEFITFFNFNESNFQQELKSHIVFNKFNFDEKNVYKLQSLLKNKSIAILSNNKCITNLSFDKKLPYSFFKAPVNLNLLYEELPYFLVYCSKILNKKKI